MVSSATKNIVKVCGAVGAVLAILTQVGPESARSNLGGWTRLVGLVLPDWITDRRAFVFALVLVGLSVAWYFRRYIPFEIRLKRKVSQATMAESPTAPPTPTSISARDEKLIQDMRTLWELYGTQAVHALSGMYDTLLARLRGKLYWWILLTPSSEALQESIKSVAVALAHDSTLELTEVRRRFNQMLDAYIEAIRWLYLLDQHGDANLHEENIAKLRRSWSEDHLSFRQKLNELETVSGHRRTLTGSLAFAEDRMLVRFETEATTPKPDRGEQAQRVGLLARDLTGFLDERDAAFSSALKPGNAIDAMKRFGDDTTRLYREKFLYRVSDAVSVAPVLGCHDAHLASTFDLAASANDIRAVADSLGVMSRCLSASSSGAATSGASAS